MGFCFSTSKSISDLVLAELTAENSIESIQMAYDKLNEKFGYLKEISPVMENINFAISTLKNAKSSVEAISILDMDGGLSALIEANDKLQSLESLSNEELASVNAQCIKALEAQDASWWDKFKKACAEIWQAIKDFFRRMWWHIRSVIGPNREVYKAALAIEDGMKKFSAEMERYADDFIKECPSDIQEAKENVEKAEETISSDFEKEVNRLSQTDFDQKVGEINDIYKRMFGEDLFASTSAGTKSEPIELSKDAVKVSPAPYANETLNVTINVEGGILEYKEAINGLNSFMQGMKNKGVSPATVTAQIRSCLMEVFKKFQATTITNEDVLDARQFLIEGLSKVETAIKADIGKLKADGVIINKFEVDPNAPSYDIDIELTPSKKDLGEMGWDFHKMIEFSKLYAETLGKFDAAEFERYLDMCEKIMQRIKFADDVTEENKAWANRLFRFAIQEARDALKMFAQWQKKLSLTSKMCMMLTGRITSAFKSAVNKRISKE